MERELVIDRGKMERYCSTGQSTQRAVAQTEEEEDINETIQKHSKYKYTHITKTINGSAGTDIN